MPTFQVTNPDTGQVLRLTGDSPPTEAELEEIFAAQAPVTPQTTIGEDILGGVESAGVIASNIIAEPLAGLAGIGAAIVPGGQTGAEAVESTRQRLAIQPESEASHQQPRLSSC